MSTNAADLAITNGAVLSGGALQPLDIGIAGGRIAALGHGLRGAVEVDARGCYVVPGIIDLHTHGIHFESCESETLDRYAAIEAERGATTFFPTLFAPPEHSAANMERLRRASHDLHDLPQVGGFRMESPYLANAGGGLSSDTRPIRRETTSMLLAAGGGLIRIWDISPELPGAVDEIRYLSERGIVCSLAHTQTTIAQARAAVDAGARLVTHLFDTFVLPVMTDPGVYPAGLVDYLLTEDRVTCEIIADGTHVHPLLVEKALRCKTADRLAFVTDSNYGAGLPPGRYTLPNDWGPVAIDGPNNGVRLLERGMVLSGSALTPLDVFRNAVQMFNKDIATASRLCSAAQARLLGLNKGEIAIGKDADVIVLDEQLELVCTIAAGGLVYQRGMARR